MVRKALFLTALCLVVAGAALAAEETDSQVPELSAFHEIIYPIWHTAYPEKDLAALKSYVPEINKLAGKIYEAKLPGILRDKQARWDAGLAEFKKAVEAYAAAAQGQDGQALLDAAEALHARYEMLVRTVRPVLKEMDAFHRVLYVIYHKYLPDGKTAEIKAVSADLTAQAEAVVKATLPKRLEAKAVEFQKAAADLLAAARALEETCRTGEAAAVKDAVEVLHSRYQALEKIFD